MLQSISPAAALSQGQSTHPTPAAVPARDTVVQAGAEYQRGGLYRALFGNDYRDLWTVPVRLPFLDLSTYAGGLRPTKEGGHGQTKTLHFVASNGTEWVFRPVKKEILALNVAFKGTIIDGIFKDQLAASHPSGMLPVPPLLEAVGVLHAVPEFFVMPNDTLLGKDRQDFAGVLGALEQVPTVPDEAQGFGGAVKIIDSEDLLKELNKDPGTRVDTRTFLAARLVDMLVGDNDRYAGQWRWARLRRDDDAPWEPIPNDRDKAFVSYEGLLLKLGRFVWAQNVTYEKAYPSLTALFANAIEFDRRLLVGLDKPTWDSVAKSVQKRITNAVIDSAMNTVPAPYRVRSAELAAKLRSRRDLLPDAALGYYRTLFQEADIHATDANDRATIIRANDGSVEVRLQSGTAAPYFQRRFDDAETKEIRVYLHGGDDTAVVTGHVPYSIAIKIIGGNGTNTLVDSSTVGGEKHRARLYDKGAVGEQWNYKPDTVDGVAFKPDTAWDRKPWVEEYGRKSPPQRDRGNTFTPMPAFRGGADLGITPQLTLTRERFGFRSYPYANKYELTGAFSTRTKGFEVELATDNRRENSPLHFLSDEFVSQLELVEFHGFGNDAPDVQANVFDVKQTEFMFHPAVGFAITPRSDLSVGPVVKYVSTDSAPGHYIAANPPYGIGGFGAAGLQADLRYDSRDSTGFPRRGVVAIFSGAAYPGIWDDKKGPFEKLSASAASYFTLPVLSRPVLALRAGGQKLIGDFPYYEAAFLGGASTIRTYHYRQFLGDEAVYGTAELRVPVATFTFLLPLNFGLLGYTDDGRVWVKGNSPGGWHTVAGAGFWLGIVNPNTGITVLISNRSQDRVSLGFGFYF